MPTLNLPKLEGANEEKIRLQSSLRDYRAPRIPAIMHWRNTRNVDDLILSVINGPMWNIVDFVVIA